MAESIGALHVSLSASAAAFAKDLKDARGALGQMGPVFAAMGKAAVAAGAALAAASAAAGAALIAITKSAANTGDELNKMSQKVGVSVEDLSALKHAANLSDVSMEGLQTSLGRLARTMSDAENGLATAERGFKDIGVEVKAADGTLRPIRDVLLDVSDKFAGMTDETKRAALAQEIFGRAGLQMLPLLNQGSAAIREQMEEARRLGIVWSTEAAQAAEAFNDNLTRLQTALGGIGQAIGKALIPTLNNLLELAVKFVQTEGFREWVQSVGDTIRRSAVPTLMLLARTVLTVHDGFRFLTNSMRGWMAVLAEVEIARERFVAATSPWADVRQKAAADAERLRMALTKEMMASTAADAAAQGLWKSLETLQQQLEGVGEADLKMKMGLEGSTAATKLGTQAIEAQVNAIGAAAAEYAAAMEAVRAHSSALDDANGPARLSIELAKAQANAAAAAAAEYRDATAAIRENAEALRAASVVQVEALDAAIKQAQVAAIGAGEEGAAIAREALDSFKRTGAETVGFWQTAMNALSTMFGSAATTIQSSFQALTTNFGTQMTQFAGLVGGLLLGIFGQSKAAAYASAVIFAAQGVAKAFADYSWPYSMIVAAIVGAAAAVQISNISNTKMAEGGIVTSATMALIGEAGPEAVIPLDRMARFQLGGERDTTQTIVLMLDGRVIAKQMVRGMPREIRFQAGVHA